MKLAYTRALIRRKAVLASAVMLAAGFAVLGTAASASAVTCSGYTCHGHDPEIYGCAVTSTVTKPVDYKGVQVATLWNRYSSGCKANWGRGQLTTAGLNAHDTFLVEIDTTDSLGYEFMCYPGPDNGGGVMEMCNAPSGTSQVLYSDMVDGTASTTASVQVFNSAGSSIAQAFASQ